MSRSEPNRWPVAPPDPNPGTAPGPKTPAAPPPARRPEPEIRGPAQQVERWPVAPRAPASPPPAPEAAVEGPFEGPLLPDGRYYSGDPTPPTGTPLPRLPDLIWDGRYSSGRPPAPILDHVLDVSVVDVADLRKIVPDLREEIERLERVNADLFVLWNSAVAERDEVHATLVASREKVLALEMSLQHLRGVEEALRTVRALSSANLGLLQESEQREAALRAELEHLRVVDVVRQGSDAVSASA